MPAKAIDRSKELIALQKDLTPVHFDNRVKQFFGRAIRQFEAGFQRLEHFFKTIEFGTWGKRESKQQRGFTKLSEHLERVKKELSMTALYIPARYGQGPHSDDIRKEIKESFENSFNKFNQQLGTMETICGLIEDKVQKLEKNQQEDLGTMKHEIQTLKKQCEGFLTIDKGKGDENVIEKEEEKVGEIKQKHVAIKKSRPRGISPQKRSRFADTEKYPKMSPKLPANPKKIPCMNIDDVLQDLAILGKKQEDDVALKQELEEEAVFREELVEVPIQSKDEIELRYKLRDDFTKILLKLKEGPFAGEITGSVKRKTLSIVKKKEWEHKVEELDKFLKKDPKDWESHDIETLVARGKALIAAAYRSIEAKKVPSHLFDQLDKDFKAFNEKYK